MPFPFVLPTTSSLSFSSNYTSDSHPSLPLTASTYRGVVKDELKKHKRLPPSSQSSHVSSVISSLDNYLPYLATIEAVLHGRPRPSDQVNVTARSPSALAIEWRPTLSESAVPGRQIGRVEIQTLHQELLFAVSTLAQAHTLTARNVLHPLYVTTSAVPSPAERVTAIQTATKHLLDAANIYAHLASHAGADSASTAAPSASASAPAPSPAPKPLPCADISPSTLRGLSSLALAEATLLAVLKDDPYPAVVAQSRNETDKEYLFKAPDIPKVRAHLFARLCLAAAEHASQASSLCGGGGSGSGSGSGTKVNESLLRYLEDTRRTAKARACRFFGIDAELGGETGKALGWLRAGLQELGVNVSEREGVAIGAGGKASGGKRAAFSRFRKDLTEKREDRRVEKETTWGSDGGKLEETRVIEYLEMRWEKFNNLVDTQTIPAPGPLLSQMPSGREIHSVKPYRLPELERNVLDAARAPPDREDIAGGVDSSDDETAVASNPPGSYPGSRQEYGSGTPAGYY